MSQYLLTIIDSEDAFVRKLLQTLPGVQVEKVNPEPTKKPLTTEQQEWVDDLKQGLVDVERHQRGEIELTSFDDFMQELDAQHEVHWGKRKAE